MKTNYDKVLQDIISNLTTRKKILIHSCCGPCSSYVIEYLNKYFDITILYYNPNIYPFDEYQKRLATQEKIAYILNPNIKVINAKYDKDEYYKLIKGHEKDKEGEERCHICYRMRLLYTCLYAKEHNYDYFTTTLSVSPYKNSEIINNIGKELESKYNVNYLYADFKKRNGYKRSIELSKEYNLYRQDYCGCIFSKNYLNEDL